jgi:hypothetical protein
MKPQRPPFSPYSKPTPPAKPQETIPQPDLIDSARVTSYSNYNVQHLLSELDSITVEAVEEYGEIETTVNFYRVPKIVKNPHYDKQLAEYEAKQVAYESAIKFWEEDKVAYDLAEVERAEAQELKELERLKAKYENKKEKTI